MSEPWFGAEQQQGLRDFWRVYDERYAEILEETTRSARAHAEFGPIVAAMDEATIRAQNERSRAQLARAIDGGWAEYEADLRLQGATYAQAGISFAGWYDLVGAFQRHIVPLLVARYAAEPARLSAALSAMQRFVDRVMATLGTAYLDAKEALIQHHRKLEAEAALRLSEERFRILVESVQEYAILMLDPEGHIVSWGRGAERIKGWRADEILGQHFSRFYPPEDVVAGKPAWELEVAARDGRVEDEGWRVRKDGSRFWANVVISALCDSSGTLLGFAKVTRDFSERRRAEQQLAQTNRFLDSLLENLPAMVFVKDAEALRFLRINHVGEELLGLGRAELVGKSDHDFFPPEQADAFVAKDREVLASGQLVTVAEEPIATPAGTRWLHTRKIPVADEAGRPRYLLGISLDITDMKRAQEQVQTAYQELEKLNRVLEQQNEELARVNRAKSDFLAMMSHELRTPLNSIIGFSEVLADQKFGPLNERQRRYISNVNDSGRHLLTLINDLLDLSKIEAGRLEIVRQACAPRVMATQAVGTLQPLADARQVTIAVAPGSDKPLMVSADPARLKQIFYNLLSNAIKFSPTGGQVRMAFDAGERPAFVRISVSDDGPGIAPEDATRLFTAFTQLPSGKEKGGTGLGLALTKQLVELMGGVIGLDSTPGKGATFWVELPVHVAGAAPEAAVAPAPKSAPLALVVDDDPKAQELIVLMLQESGYRTMAVASGDEAVAVARRHRPDVITLDVFLPTIDGWDVLKLLKSDPDTETIPVVMVTISSDRGRAFGLGAVEHLIKPVARDALLAALARRSFTTKVKEREVNVIAIDDDPKQLELFRAALEPHGFRVRTESNARAGIEATLRGPVDLVLLDLVMPDLSGVEVVSTLRADERTRAVPILLITAHELSAAQRARLNGDVEAVLTKGSLRIEQLLQEIGRVLRRQPAAT